MLPFKGTYILPYLKHNFVHSKCPICLEDFKERSFLCQTRCDHVFHIECANTWFKNKYKCPCCRRDIAHNMKSNYSYQSNIAQNGTVELKIELETNYDIVQTE
ncbi:hypothetical protein HELRODRAFT_71954 [Helobdella robusta]|uniref:RING-type domain-containing protein n=1 Tax=Helobdella robusta TaxID=6412 RepID=T1G0T4_HELRO|nr:hypothetical protein HELRODRAFT_71954 [Helobdella robusta]ESO10737.1 hypothetical protein HELRODRAFT_71954 [Helobdella robusta]